MEALPDSIPLADLLATHPEYNPAVATPSGDAVGMLDKYRDLYEGGERFERRKGAYLRSRQMDSNRGYRQARLAAAHYTGQMASIIDWLAGSCFQKNPGVESTDPYWSSLNEDADGTGQDLAAVLYLELLEVMIYRRAYLSVTFPNADSRNLEQAKGLGGSGDGRIGFYSAAQIDDWMDDEKGQLVLARIRSVESIRDSMAQPKRERWTWTYVTPAMQRSYSVERDISSLPIGLADGFKDKIINGSAPSFHDYGGKLPIVRVDVPIGLWVAHRLASTQLAIFNADAALAFLYDMNCFQFPVISNPTKPNAISLSEMHALYLEIGGSASMLAPSGVPFEQLRQYIDKLEARLYLAVQAMALQAASKDEHGRQSGVAKQRDMDAAHVLMACYRGRIKDALLKIFDVIKFVRKEKDLEIKITGLDQETPSEPDNEDPEKEKPLGFKPKPAAAD